MDTKILIETFPDREIRYEMPENVYQVAFGLYIQLNNVAFGSSSFTNVYEQLTDGLKKLIKVKITKGKSKPQAYTNIKVKDMKGN